MDDGNSTGPYGVWATDPLELLEEEVAALAAAVDDTTAVAALIDPRMCTQMTCRPLLSHASQVCASTRDVQDRL
jgi:hypothetical protein